MGVSDSTGCLLPGESLVERFLTDLRFCCAANVVTASEAREPDGYRDCSDRLLESMEICLWRYYRVSNLYMTICSTSSSVVRTARR